MTSEHAHWRNPRRIVERVVVEGELVLETPAHFGSGDAEGPASLSLVRDPAEGRALLPGASIAGALRNYWRERKYGYGASARDTDLFGARRGASDAMEGYQSLLIVDDALGDKPQVELRPGVRIRADTRTAEAKKLYDVELLRAGTRFPLRFELLIDDQPPAGMKQAEYDALPPEKRQEELARRRKALLTDLALALEGLKRGEIGLGARKRRGFGRCRVDEWHARRYDMGTANGLLAWLAGERGWADDVREEAGDSLAAVLGVEADEADRRYRFEMNATFSLDGSLLVRSGLGEADLGPDMAHLRRPTFAPHGDEPPDLKPVLPGTSLAGVLRARAQRIANTLARDAAQAQDLVDGMFGVGPEDEDDGEGEEGKGQASRLVVHETAVDGVHSLVQTRIRIDRFTGGAMDGYLFSEAPVFGGDNSELKVELVLRGPAPQEPGGEPVPPSDAEIGLLLLLLKDLWTGDLTVGGESSVGRGRLRGESADLCRVDASGRITWHLERGKDEDEDRLRLTSEPEQEDVWQSLGRYVTALNRHLGREVDDAGD